MNNSDEQKLGKLIQTRHPEYASMLAHWNFLELCYKGGREWFEGNIFRYMKEGDTEFFDRVRRAYRFNHSKEVVDLVGKYIFKSKIYRNEDDASDAIKNFWEASDKSGQSSIDKIIREIERKSSIFGRIWVVVDNNRGEDGEGREYAYLIRPQDALNMSYGDDGLLNWILFRETYRDDEDPIESSGQTRYRYRLWTRDKWYLIEQRVKGNEKYLSDPVVAAAPMPGTSKSTQVTFVIDTNVRAYIADQGEHNLGIVPAFACDYNESESLYSSPSLIADIAYLDRACANYLSNLDAIIQDQSFSQLAMPAQGLMPGEDTYNKMVEAGTKRIFLYDGDGGAQPFYLSPDPRQAELIITAISKIINEIYHTVGMAGERTKQDNSVGIDNSSGVAKAYDFERVNALLTTKASSLKVAEINMAWIVSLWVGEEVSKKEIAALLKYPESFDVRGISDELSIASDLSILEAPSKMRKEQLKILVNKLFPMISDQKRDEMIAEIEAMTAEDFMAGGKGLGDMLTSDANFLDLGLKGNRQGENNKEATTH